MFDKERKKIEVVDGGRLHSYDSRSLCGYIIYILKEVLKTLRRLGEGALEAGTASYPFLHIYAGSKVQSTNSGLGSRKQTPLRVSIAQDGSTFSCFFEFDIFKTCNLFYQNYW